MARVAGLTTDYDTMLATVQGDLFVVGAALADPNPDGNFHRAVTSDHAAYLERGIDALEAELPPLTMFILPGGSMAASQIHLARTVCRRAERLAVALNHFEGEDVPPDLIIYLNRLSDFLFVLARAVNHRAGLSDVPWAGI